jgi:hypothetical protein
VGAWILILAMALVLVASGPRERRFWILLCGLVLAASAPSERRFWIVRGPEGNCTIVETEPAPSQIAIVKLGQQFYRSWEAALADFDRVCISQL